MPLPSQSPGDAGLSTGGLAPRLLAEAVRVHEDALGAPLNEPQADQQAQAAGGDLERRIVVRAQALSVAPALRAALAHLRGGTQATFAAALAGALLAGAGSARLVLGSYGDGPVNFFLALASLLGLHTLMLLVWLVVVLFQPGSGAVGVLGGLVLRLGRRVTSWLHRRPVELAAWRATGEVLASPPLGRWTLSTISHSLWLAYLLGCLAAVLLLLGTRQYDFAWETTILSDRSYAAAARMVAAPVEAFGFAVPDPAEIARSRRTGFGQSFAARERWGGLLVGCLVVYGLLPRGLALLASLAGLMIARARYRLDTTRPGFARLQGRLVALAQPVGVVDADEPRLAREGGLAKPAAPITGPGAVGIVGLEIEPPGGGWPPAVPGLTWLELGFADDRTARHKVVEQAASADPRPRAILVVCSLAATPDRGTGAILSSLAQACPVPVALLMTHGQRLRERSPLAQVEQRISDWQQLAARSGLNADHVLEVDLDHLTAESRRRLAHFLGADGADATPQAPLLGHAFDLIADHAAGWQGEPDAAARAELHRAIARLWEAERGETGWRDLLSIRSVDLASPTQGLTAAAERMISLLPVRLRLDPRWLAAGAAGGALACVATAGLVAPVAIASLPAWAGLGAALTSLLPKRTDKQRPPQQAAAAPDLAPAVDAAALFAMLLELQGRNETTISRVLDAAVGAETDDLPLGDARAVRSRLDGLQGRFEAALIAEEARA